MNIKQNDLIKKLMSMVNTLIEPSKNQSLERLQFIELHLEKQDMESGKTKETQLKNVEDKLVLVSFLQSYKISLHYFVRGRRKYFDHKITMPSSLRVIEKKALGIRDIKNFLARFTIDNEIYYNEELLRLIGINSVLVPSLLLIEYVYSHCRNHLDINDNIIIKLQNSQKANEVYTLSLSSEKNALYLVSENGLILTAQGL